MKVFQLKNVLLISSVPLCPEEIPFFSCILNFCVVLLVSGHQADGCSFAVTQNNPCRSTLLDFDNASGEKVLLRMGAITDAG